MTTDDKRLDANVIHINSKGVAVTTKRATVTAGVVNVVKAGATPKRQHVQCPLTAEHRKALSDLITDWVSTRNLCRRPLTHGGAWSQLYARHLQGAVASINEIEEEEFEGSRSWLLQQIRMTEKSNPQQARRKPGYSTTRVTTIQTRCRILGITEQVRKQYQLDRWGKESLTEFSDAELDEFVTYVRQTSPSFQHKELTNPRDTELRELALVRLLDRMEQEAKAQGKPFDRHALRCTKEELHAWLREQDPQLFSIAPGTFEDFWKKKRKGLCRVNSGRRPIQN